ncbi:hypothetical protein [Acinetobacter beijerinckii]|uniref:Uncharacterized protein n=1 Tax=Acinetobacter beijerinckii ANC 3835 TaxID=1217649 RepID=N9FLL7_9GAMM|nr:hypothetical protein [Acinetobacter beijerinckii]ENW05744.1 hypothetical protein F934_01101 [Acinetobacter beijerinckii ANC 3835]
MNDFFLANNESLPYVFIDQKIEVKQIQVKNLDRFNGYANEFKKLESYSIETISSLINTQMINVMGMCSIGTNLSPETFIENAQQTKAIVELVLKIIEVNEAFFKKEKKQSRAKKEANEVSWFHSFAYLIKSGHSHDEIMNMTYGAFMHYLKEAQALERQQIKTYAIASRVANNAKQQGWDKYLKQLDS